MSARRDCPGRPVLWPGTKSIETREKELEVRQCAVEEKEEQLLRNPLFKLLLLKTLSAGQPDLWSGPALEMREMEVTEREAAVVAIEKEHKGKAEGHDKPKSLRKSVHFHDQALSADKATARAYTMHPNKLLRDIQLSADDPDSAAKKATLELVKRLVEDNGEGCKDNDYLVLTSEDSAKDRLPAVESDGRLALL